VRKYYNPLKVATRATLRQALAAELQIYASPHPLE